MTAFDTATGTIFRDVNIGVDASYVPVGGGAPVTVRVVVERNIERLGFESDSIGKHDELSFIKADIPTPQRGDTFTVGLIVFNLISVLNDDEITQTWVVDL
jgi:hypothetical protein